MRYLDFEKPIKELKNRINDLSVYSTDHEVELAKEITPLEEKLLQLERDIYGSLTTWQRILLARHPDRPYFLDFVHALADDFIELHGDRCLGDDQAMLGGFATFEGRKVIMLGHQKGRTTEENIKRRFGMPVPEGFRKARRMMEMAARFGLPIISFVDTKGAYPGMEAEEHGQANIIAENLQIMARLGVPIIIVITGEGGSGGALAISVGDRILMMENAYYAVCSPEACATIIWKDATKASEAVESMRILSPDLLELGIIDEIIPEPLGGAHRQPDQAFESVRQAIVKNLESIESLPPEQLIEERYQKFRRMGKYHETE